MPNYVENVVRIKGDDSVIRKMLESIKNDEQGIGSIDFNKIIPMPESLNIECGTRTDRGLRAYKEFISQYMFENRITNLDLVNIPEKSEKEFLCMRSDIKHDEWELGKQAFQNQQKYGASTWYEWSIGNWGTKWNAFGYDEDFDYRGNDELRFETAWSAPHTVMMRLSEMYPELKFEHEWADEDLGQNCGRKVYYGGEKIEEYYPESSKDCLEFAASVWNYDLESMGFVLNKTGTDYIYVNSEDYQLIELLDKPMLFTNERLTDKDIPEQLYCYDLRESDDGYRFCSIEPKVKVNHGGSVITKEPINFGEKGYITLTDETSPNFISGGEISLAQYMNEDFSIEKTDDQTQGEMKL